MKSANETKYWLCLLRDGLKLDNTKLNILLNEVIEISNIVGSIIIKLKDTKSTIIREKYVKYGTDYSNDFIDDLNNIYKINLVE